MVFDLFRERICQPSEAPVSHAHTEVLAFNVACVDRNSKFMSRTAVISTWHDQDIIIIGADMDNSPFDTGLWRGLDC